MAAPQSSARLGLLLPATNVVAEEELNAMRPRAVSIFASRYDVGDARMDSAQAVSALISATDASLPQAIRLLRAARPTQVIHIMSAHSFRVRHQEMRRVAERLARECGVRVTDGPAAFTAALRGLGAERIAVLSPYHPVVEAAVVAVLEAAGHKVIATASLGARSTRSVASTSREAVAGAVVELAGSGPDAVVQIGGNLPFARLAASAERKLGLPVLAANTTLLWHALRSGGLDEQVPGWGCLLERH
jgi:maleate isomerase